MNITILWVQLHKNERSQYVLLEKQLGILSICLFHLT